MAKHSAGLLMYRWKDGELEVFIAHPGGPLHENRDEGDWTIPKGLVERGEAAFEAARREFHEETGIEPQGPFLPLGAIRQRSGKLVDAWAFKGEPPDDWQLSSNLFDMEWPRGSGQTGRFPEIDRAEFFGLDEARIRLNPAQAEFLDRLVMKMGRKILSALDFSCPSCGSDPDVDCICKPQ